MNTIGYILLWLVCFIPTLLIYFLGEYLFSGGYYQKRYVVTLSGLICAIITGPIGTLFILGMFIIELLQRSNEMVIFSVDSEKKDK